MLDAPEQSDILFHSIQSNNVHALHLYFRFAIGTGGHGTGGGARRRGAQRSGAQRSGARGHGAKNLGFRGRGFGAGRRLPHSRLNSI